MAYPGFKPKPGPERYLGIVAAILMICLSVWSLLLGVLIDGVGKARWDDFLFPVLVVLVIELLGWIRPTARFVGRAAWRTPAPPAQAYPRPLR